MDMLTKVDACLHTLPVELVYHLIHYLDTETVLLSFRYVCRRFYFISDAYRSYDLNLHSLSKGNFYRFCRVIDPTHVLSLSLSDDQCTPGQIGLFLSFFQLHQFDSLRSLTLIDIDNYNLNSILNDLSHGSLQQLTIKSRTSVTWKKSTLDGLSKILQQSSLQQFTLSIWCFEIHEFIWPEFCLIEYLHISSRITFEQYCMILERCSKLQTLLIKDVLWNDPELILSSIYSQLKSLTIEDNRMDMARIEQILSLTPVLTHFKVIGMAYLNDLHSWERILRTKLPNLNRFEFFFLSWKNVNYDLVDLPSLIRPYQTPFWLESKQWIVNCDYIFQPNEVMLYTLPICKTQFQFYETSNKVTCSNTSKINLDDQKMMTNIIELRLNPTKLNDHEMHFESIIPRFSKVQQLIIDLDDKFSINQCRSLCQLVDLSLIIEIKLNLHYDFSMDRETTVVLVDFLQRLSSLHTFELSNNLSTLQSMMTLDDLCSIIPKTVKHLKITVKNINDMKRIFDRFTDLMSITFQFSFIKSMPSSKIIESFLDIKKDSTYRKDDCSVYVWLNK